MKNYYFDCQLNPADSIYTADFIIVNSVEDFMEECEIAGVISNGVKQKGVFEWDDDALKWNLTDFSTAQNLRMKTLCERSEEWNIIVTLKDGTRIKTNDTPVPMNEVQEAINVMLKPSFFGSRIKKIELFVE